MSPRNLESNLRALLYTPRWHFFTWKMLECKLSYWFIDIL